MFVPLDKLGPWLDHNNLTVKVCGQVLEIGSAGRIALFDYLIFEQTRYNESFSNISNFPVDDQDKTKYFHFEITMRSSMGFQDNRTIKVKAVDKKGDFEFAVWRIQEVEITGSCVDSKNLNRSLIINEWVPKLEYVNKAAKEFMNEIIRKIPLTDENFFHSNSTVFPKPLSSEKYFEWFKKFSALFKHRAELYSFIISENIDHIVFRTSHVFEDIKNNERIEIWHFIIEATCERKLEEHWTIRQMQFRPDYKLFDNIERHKEAFMQEIDCLIQEIEIISQNRSTENLYKLEKYRNAIRFDYPELVPKHDNKTDLFVKLFEITSSLKFEKCEKMLKKEDWYLTATIHCQYCHQDFYYSNDHRKLSKRVELEIVGEMDEYKIEAKLIEIKLINTINIKQSKNANNLVSGEKVEMHHDMAKNVSRLLIGQSSFEYLNWEDDLEKLVEYFEKDDFELRICGKSHNENQIEIFKKYLERNRKTTKLSKYDVEIYTKNHVFGINFTIVYTSINSMGFFMTENYTIGAMNTLNRCRMKVCPQQVKYWSIKSVEIEGACLFDSLDSRYIYALMPENIQFENEIDEFISKVQIPYIGNEGDINVNLYSKSFKGYIMTNPNMSEVYQFEELNIYMGNFVKVNKLRQKLNSTIIIHEKNHVVSKIPMIFDQFLLTNQSTNDEWIFLIEGSKSSEEKWEITKLLMSPKLELITNNMFLERSAENHVAQSDHYVEFARKVVANRDLSNKKVDSNNCKNIIYNTSTEFNQFNQSFVGFLNLADPKTELIYHRNILHPFTVDAFIYKIIYQITISGKKKFIKVYYFAKYDFKYGYYHDSKFGLVCPSDDI